MDVTLILLISFSGWMFLSVKLIEKGISPVKSFGGGFVCAGLLFVLLAYVFVFDKKKPDAKVEALPVKTEAAVITATPTLPSPITNVASKKLDADVIVSELPLKEMKKTVSGDGKRPKYLYKITGLDKNYNESAGLEVIGNDRHDADVVAWNCSKYSADGNRESLKASNNACYDFFVAVVTKIVPDARQVVDRLILSSEKQAEGMVTSERVSNLSIEIDYGYFFVRNVGR